MQGQTIHRLVAKDRVQDVRRKDRGAFRASKALKAFKQHRMLATEAP